MALKNLPTFSVTNPKMFEVPQPGIGGLNLNDLEYEQEVNQTPYMLNMMYRNGTFSKRYGQELLDEDTHTYANEIYAFEYFNGKLFVHSGTKMYIDGTEVASLTLSAQKGIFIKFYNKLYYYCNSVIKEYKYENNAWSWNTMTPYVPDVFINCQPQSGGTYDMFDDLNLLSLNFKCVYNGDGSSTNYFPYGNEDDIIDWDATDTNIIVKVDDVVKTKGTHYSVDKTNKKIVFVTAPASGSDNVEIQYTMKSTNLKEDRDRLLACKYSIAYGANGYYCLFMGGGGDSKIFYSESYDATFFPEPNWIIIGSSEQDITGFGLQYNSLFVFKPREVHSVYAYTVTASVVTTEDEGLIGTQAFATTVVNSMIGCDAPYSIQLINNQLTWFNSNEGVCTLVSTNISDERNVRVISRNINRTDNMGIKGILDYTEDLSTIMSADYDSKYFLCFPSSGYCFMWDYAIAPFSYTSSKVTDPRTLDWFLFDKFYVKQFLIKDKELLYISNKSAFNKNIVLLNKTFVDLDFNNDGDADGIESYYMTPFYQFNAVEYLKDVKNIYVQCRGDTASVIDMYYYTEGSATPEQENESIRIGGKIWAHFAWDNFQWLVVNWANTFMRKCGLKKIQMCSFLFKNNEPNRDMSISHLGISYTIVKTIR